MYKFESIIQLLLESLTLKLHRITIFCNNHYKSIYLVYFTLCSDVNILLLYFIAKEIVVKIEKYISLINLLIINIIFNFNHFSFFLNFYNTNCKCYYCFLMMN